MAKYKTFGRPEAVWNKLGGESGVDAFLSGKTKVVPVGGSILTIDRTVGETYPNWVNVAWDEHKKHSPLGTGPTTVDLSSTVLYFHPAQKNDGGIYADKLYKLLESTGLIEHCHDLRFGEEIVKQPHLWPVAWDGLCLPLWKSVVQDFKGNDRRLPVLYKNDDVVGVVWHWLCNNSCDNRNLTVLCAS